MSAAIFNLIMGALAIGAGVAGYTLPFTNSPIALIVVGVAIAGLGVFQLVKGRR